MEQDQIQNGVKTILFPGKQQQSLKTYTKAEPKPAFIDSDLQPYYEQTDLTLMWVYECCKTLKPLKGIDVNDMQVEWWYKEFIRMGWKKKDFDKQFESVKRATLFNRIDLESWIKAEIMYNEIDFNVAVERRIESLIQRGKYLKNKKVELSETDIKAVELAVSRKIEFELNNKRYELMESAVEELKKKYYETLSKKKKKILDLSMKEKMELANHLFDTGKVKGDKTRFEYQVVLHNLEEHADLIPDELL